MYVFRSIMVSVISPCFSVPRFSLINIDIVDFDIYIFAISSSTLFNMRIL
uniref:Uncharacterized protein n=1 Tax=Arundo donax TaxID=35708 RepID=A0A0A8YGI0_ARUDO